MAYCKNCGNKLEDGMQFCPKCGTHVLPKRTCPHCGTLVKEDDVFCRNCGYKMQQENVCPYCGALIKDGDIFCQNCGAEIDKNKTIVTFAEPQQKIDFKKDNSSDGNNRGNLFIRWNGRWALIDYKVQIWVNGIKQGEYSFKDGFEVVVPISSPEMVVETKLSFHKTKKVLSLNPQENYSYNLVYNIFIGSFGFVLCDNDGNELETDKLHWGYFILFFLVPLVGFIYALSVRKKKPATSKQAFMISLLSVAVSLILSFFMPVVMSRYSEMKETEKFVADSLEKVRKDSIKLVEEKEKARLDSIDKYNKHHTSNFVLERVKEMFGEDDFFSEEYKKLRKQMDIVAEQNNIDGIYFDDQDYDIWIGGNGGCGEITTTFGKVANLTSNTANVMVYNVDECEDEPDYNIILSLVYEKNNWYVDDISNPYEKSLKNTIKRFINSGGKY